MARISQLGMGRAPKNPSRRAGKEGRDWRGYRSSCVSPAAWVWRLDEPTGPNDPIKFPVDRLQRSNRGGWGLNSPSAKMSEKEDKPLHLYGRGSAPTVPFRGAPPILEPILVGIGMFTGGTIWILTHGHISLIWGKVPLLK